jgi:uncharacterized protein (TIGR02145 family)
MLAFFIVFLSAFLLSCSDEFPRIDFLAPGEGEAGGASSSSSRGLSSSSPVLSSSSLALSSSSFSVSFGSLHDSRDGQTYRTVVIGSQTWMAENLNFDAAGSMCYGDNTGGDSQNRSGTYGRLYNWNAALTACPSGWCLPTDADWTALTNHVGTTPGSKLKAASGWNSGGNGTDDFGFSALPGGYGGSSGLFSNVGNSGFWWSATEYDDGYAWRRSMGSSHSDGRHSTGKLGLLSVRCLKD